jgi:hypothetical protein
VDFAESPFAQRHVVDDPVWQPVHGIWGGGLEERLREFFVGGFNSLRFVRRGTVGLALIEREH